jgi:hypothetical protein
LAHIWKGCAHIHFQQLLQLWFSGLPQKKGFPILSVCGGKAEHVVFVRWLPGAERHQSNFQRYGTLEDGHIYLWFHQFSQCACILHLDIN